MALWGSLCSPGQCRPALPHITFFLASVPFSSSPLRPGLAHLKESFTLIFAPGSVFRRTRVKEASVDSHGPLYVPLLQHVPLCMTTCPFTCLDKEPHAKRSCVFLIYILSLGRESSRCSMDPQMSEWWIGLLTILEFLVWSLRALEMCLLHFPTNAWYVYTHFMIQWVLIVHICAQGQNQERIRWINIFKDLGWDPGYMTSD